MAAKRSRGPYAFFGMAICGALITAGIGEIIQGNLAVNGNLSVSGWAEVNETLFTNNITGKSTHLFFDPNPSNDKYLSFSDGNLSWLSWVEFGIENANFLSMTSNTETTGFLFNGEGSNYFTVLGLDKNTGQFQIFNMFDFTLGAGRNGDGGGGMNAPMINLTIQEDFSMQNISTTLDSDLIIDPSGGDLYLGDTNLETTGTITVGGCTGCGTGGEVSDIWVNESGDTMTGTLTGTNITANNFTGTFYGNGAGITGLTASQVSLGNVYNVKQINESIGTTKGDLICYTGSSAPVRVAVGTDGQLLYANSSEASGVQWRTPSAGGSDVNYAVQGTCLNQATMTDGQTMYWGNTGLAPTTTAENTRIYIPTAGTVTTAYVFAHCATAGTAEGWTMYIRKNGATDYHIQNLALSSAQRVWTNITMNAPVAQGDYFEIKEIQPTWATNPANCRRSFILYVD